MTTQSRSPRTSFANRAGSVPRTAATAGSRSLVPLSRVLGLGGSSSRTRLSTSSNAARRKVSRSRGVVPVSSS